MVSVVKDINYTLWNNYTKIPSCLHICYLRKVRVGGILLSYNTRTCLWQICKLTIQVTIPCLQVAYHLEIFDFHYMRTWCQKQVSQAGKSNCIPQYSFEWNYLFLPEISASGTKILIYQVAVWWINIACCGVLFNASKIVGVFWPDFP